MAKKKMEVTEAHRALARAITGALAYNKERNIQPRTPPELAKMSGVGERTIDYMMRCIKDPQLGNIVRIASTFDQQAWSLLYSEGDRDLLKIIEAYRRAPPDGTGRKMILLAVRAAEDDSKDFGEGKP